MTSSPPPGTPRRDEGRAAPTTVEEALIADLAWAFRLLDERLADASRPETEAA